MCSSCSRKNQRYPQCRRILGLGGIAARSRIYLSFLLLPPEVLASEKETFSDASKVESALSRPGVQNGDPRPPPAGK